MPRNEWGICASSSLDKQLRVFTDTIYYAHSTHFTLSVSEHYLRYKFVYSQVLQRDRQLWYDGRVLVDFRWLYYGLWKPIP
jgi:hypothetical protein